MLTRKLKSGLTINIVTFEIFSLLRMIEAMQLRRITMVYVIKDQCYLLSFSYFLNAHSRSNNSCYGCISFNRFKLSSFGKNYIFEMKILVMPSWGIYHTKGPFYFCALWSLYTNYVKYKSWNDEWNKIYLQNIGLPNFLNVECFCKTCVEILHFWNFFSIQVNDKFV